MGGPRLNLGRLNVTTVIKERAFVTILLGIEILLETSS
jgi:hypothetical protein